MKIRKAKYADLIICAGVQKDSESTRRTYSKKDDLLTRKYLRRYFDNGYSTILVAEDASGIIGHIIFSYDEWNNSIHLDLLFVRLSKQNQGIGSKLLNAVFDRAKKQGVRIVFLETSKAENNNIGFYEKNGFSVAGYVNELYKEIPGDAIILSRKLE
jgi:ribosomal protein S18 acetylase RimI-like enzyme